MKSILKNYTFNTSTKAITATDVTTVRLDRLALITDTTTNKILYNFADSTVSTATVAGNVITLSVLQGGESNTDKLRIDYDVDTTDAAYNDDIGITKLGDGTNTINVLKSDGTAAGQNGGLMAGSYFVTTFSFTGTAAASTWLDLGNFNWVSVHIDTFSSGTANFQTTNDTTKTAIANNLVQSGVASTSAASAFAAAGLLAGPLMGRYFRINATGTPTFSGTIVARSISGVLPTQNSMSTQSGTWSFGSNSATGSAVPANAFLMGMSDGTNLQPLRSGASLGDAGGASYLAISPGIYNGASWDRLRSATAASGTTGTGVPAAGMMGHDGTNYQRIKVTTTGQYNPGPQTSGGVTVAKIASAATTNATSVKVSAGQVYGWALFNTSAATRYLKFYNLAAAPTVGTSVPVFIVPLPAGGGSNIMLGDIGTPFSTGIAYSISTGVADSDATATTANDVVGTFFYA